MKTFNNPYIQSADLLLELLDEVRLKSKLQELKVNNLERTQMFLFGCIIELFISLCKLVRHGEIFSSIILLRSISEYFIYFKHCVENKEEFFHKFQYSSNRDVRKWIHAFLETVSSEVIDDEEKNGFRSTVENLKKFDNPDLNVGSVESLYRDFKLEYLYNEIYRYCSHFMHPNINQVRKNPELILLPHMTSMPPGQEKELVLKSAVVFIEACKVATLLEPHNNIDIVNLNCIYNRLEGINFEK